MKRKIQSFRHPVLLLLFLLTGAIFSCSEDDRKNGNGQLKVIATTGMIADLVKNIGGDSIEVQSLMGPGVDPHLYKATQGDLGKLQNADIIFYNGLHLEGKMGAIFQKFQRIKTVIAIAENLDSSILLRDPMYRDTYDPHIWFDVSMWSSTTDVVAKALASADPKNEAYFFKNANNYRAELLKLHEWVSNEIARIPKYKRTLITAHDAFSYFGRAYDIEVRGLQGISTLSEFGLKDRVDLVNYIVDKQIKAVFIETSVSEKNIQSIVEGCRQQGHEVAIGGNLFSDAMGKEGEPEGTYIGMVRANVQAIVEALQ